MGTRKQYLIKKIVEVCQKLDEKGFGANHDGNVSARFDEFLFATPTAESKGAIVEDMIITLDMQGKKVQGIGRPFSEIKLHLAAYQARPEAMAVVHAHPPFATARGMCRKSLEVHIPEAVISIGDQIPVGDFAMPGEPINDQIIADCLSLADVFMLPGNGVLSIGTDIEQAYFRVELLEHVCKIDFYAQQMGDSFRLSDKDLKSLLDKRASLGLGPKNSTVISKTDVKMSPPTKAPPEVDLHALIAEEIKKAIRGAL